MINILLEEADASIDKAYAEGYKQATLECLPQVEYYKTAYEKLLLQDKKNNNKDKLFFSVAAFSIGLVAGNTLTLIIN